MKTSWHLSFWKKGTCLFNKGNSMDTGDLATQRSRASAATVLTKFSQNIQVSSPDGCKQGKQPNMNKANLRDLIAATGQVISNWIQIVNFSARVTAKFDGWPRKTIGHFFYTTSSFVHHFKSIGEFKLDLQSRNAQFGSKLVICYPVWPWNLMEDLGKQ